MQSIQRYDPPRNRGAYNHEVPQDFGWRPHHLERKSWQWVNRGEYHLWMALKLTRGGAKPQYAEIRALDALAHKHQAQFCFKASRSLRVKMTNVLPCT